MAVTDRGELLRSLPGVEEVLQSAAAGSWLRALPRPLVADLVRDAIARVRAEILAGDAASQPLPSETVSARVGEDVLRLSEPSLRPVINASGVILHTNLGRAPLGAAALRGIERVAGRYCNIEYAIAEGRRGKRDVHCGALLERILGAPAVVVNNNAAAVFLAMHELARDGEVVISRGEMVEIGDGFRIPDILEASQARLREVGCTNRTHIADYRSAIGDDTRALLRVHPSNFRQIGFTGRPTLRELVELARSESLPLIEDLGSGSLTDGQWPGLDGEPPVAESLRAGVSLVTFSGDKLLGGPQAGIIAGDPILVARVRRNPLFRALRVGKLTIAALEETLRAYLAGREEAVPALRMMRLPPSEIAARAEKLVQRLSNLGVEDAGVVAGSSLLGGGSTPMQGIATALVSLGPGPGASASVVERRLRKREPAVVVRIDGNRLLVDLRTVAESEEDELVGALAAAIRSSRG